jgi:Bacterial inner membrane protein
MTLQSLAIEAAGWTGAVLVLVGFVLASNGRIQARSRTFQWLNLLGAAGFVINSAWHGAIPSMVLNIIWCGMALFTLWRLR